MKGTFSILLLALVGFLCEAHVLTSNDAAATQTDLILDEKNGLVYSGDIIYTVDQWKRMNAPVDQKRSAGTPNSKLLWTNNTVNYELTFTPEDISQDEQVAIRAAVDEIKRYTCINFNEDNTAANRVRIEEGQGCYSHIGMVGGVQTLSLRKECRTKAIVLHEIGHLLGLRHEHNRPDRDDYITVNFENIPDGVEHHFRKMSGTDIKDLGMPYDYYSIMHASKLDFSGNNQNTITTLNPKMEDVIGTQKTLSFGDIKTINLLYNCASSAGPKCDLKASDCPKEGFLGKDCTCWCPGNGSNLVDVCDS